MSPILSCTRLAAMVGIIATTAVSTGEAAPLKAAETIVMAPHRAVYDLVLEKTRAGSSVTDVTGRMVYELTGSACEGYTQNMRFVTRMINQDGQAQLTDIRSSSWEEGHGQRLRFNTSQIKDEAQPELTTGDAARAPSSEIQVELSKPQKKAVPLGKGVMFPMQHSKHLLEAAARGDSILQADLYDGSDQGEKVYATTTVIGRPNPLGASKETSALQNAEQLDQVPSWPVSISYFEPGAETKDAIPVYELSFRFYANGVSQKLLIDYGEFAIRGGLSKIEFLEPSKCEKK